MSRKMQHQKTTIFASGHPQLMKKTACFMTRCITLLRLVLIVALLHSCCMAQQPVVSYYSNGQIKTLAVRTGVDTVEYTSYYSTGRKREHFFLYVADHRQVPFGIGQRFYANGKMSMRIDYGNIRHENITYNERADYYASGILKMHIVRRGVDTVEYKSYHKNGRIKDSLWLYYTGRRELVIGTEKHFYDNGQLAGIASHDSANEASVSRQYHKNGVLKVSSSYPTGFSKVFNKKGVQIRQIDNHKTTQVYVPKQYRKGRHFATTPYAGRIKTKHAFLVNGSAHKKIKAGTLISVQLKGDTLLYHHCLVEGFSEDSIYLTGLDYDSTFKTARHGKILKYDSTFALGYNELHTVLYARHATRARNFGAFVAYIAGVECVLLPVIEIPLISLIDNQHLDVPSMLGTCAVVAAVGVPLIYLSRHLLKTAVPKPYDMATWKFRPRLPVKR